MGCPDCANRENMLFVSDILKSTETTSDDFVILSPSNNKHISSPKFTDSNGDILIYLENDISSTSMAVIPGSSQKSRRLIRMNFTQSVTVAMSSDGIVYAEPYKFTVVDQVFEPEIAEDHTISFGGIYPYEERAPDRIFSNDGEIVYLNIFQREANRIAAVDIYSGQITLHPETNVKHLDIVSKLMLVLNTGNVNQTPTAQIGLMVPPPPPPPTIKTTTSSTFATTEAATSSITSTVLSTTTETDPQTSIQTTSTTAVVTNTTTEDINLSTTDDDQITTSSTTLSSETDSTEIVTTTTEDDDEIHTSSTTISSETHSTEIVTTTTDDDGEIHTSSTTISSETDSTEIVTDTTTASTVSVISTTEVETTTSHEEMTSISTTEYTTSTAIDPCEDLLQELEQADVSSDERIRRAASDTDQYVSSNLLNTQDVHSDNVNEWDDENTIELYTTSQPLSLFYLQLHDLIPPTTTFDYKQEVHSLYNKEEESSGDANDGVSGVEEGENENGSGMEDELLADVESNMPLDERANKMKNSVVLYKPNSRFELGRQISLSNYSWRSTHNKSNIGSEVEHKLESYQAIYVAPKHQENIPLVVILHDGPHTQSTTSYSKQINFFLAMDMAVLSINYMGSTGMGDKNLESIMGFVSQVLFINV